MPRWQVLLVLAIGSSAVGCGFQSALTRDPGVGRLAVEAAPLVAPHPEALEAALAGARAELGRSDLLGGQGYPRLVVELVRIDEEAAGIAATPHGADTLPLARGSAVGAVVRAWLERSPGAAPDWHSGDVRRVETVAQGAEPLAAGAAFRAATRAAARRAGEAAARRALGRAEPLAEPM